MHYLLPVNTKHYRTIPFALATSWSCLFKLSINTDSWSYGSRAGICLWGLKSKKWFPIHDLQCGFLVVSLCYLFDSSSCNLSQSKIQVIWNISLLNCVNSTITSSVPCWGERKELYTYHICWWHHALRPTAMPAKPAKGGKAAATRLSTNKHGHKPWPFTLDTCCVILIWDLLGIQANCCFLKASFRSRLE